MDIETFFGVATKFVVGAASIVSLSVTLWLGIQEQVSRGRMKQRKIRHLRG